LNSVAEAAALGAVRMGGRVSARSFAKQFIESRLCTRDFAGILRNVCAWFRSKEIAKIGFVFFSYFFRGWFFAMFGVTHVVFNAHLAYMQLRIARLAHIKSAQRQTQ
jgi:hypothetical protein